jgi:lysozyme
MLHGIDVSHHNEWIDWPRVRQSGVRFAIIKASEGNGYIDPLYEQNLKGALSSGIMPGSYHFFLPRIDPLEQARHYVRVLQENAVDAPTLPPCIDIETAGLTKAALNQAVRLFLDEIRKLTGRTGIIYVSPGFWSTYLPVPVISGYKLTGGSVDWAAQYPLWLAHYTSGWPYQVYPWVGWRFWQYSSAGKISGVVTKVDLNLFNGSEAELAALGAS